MDRPGDKPSFNSFLEKYDREILLKARRLNKTMTKITRHKCHLFFNHRCKDRYKLAKNTGFQFLKLRIEQLHKKIRQLDCEKDRLTKCLHAVMEPDDLKQTEVLFRNLQHTEHLRIKAGHTRKLQALEGKSNQSTTRNTVNCEKWVLNISSKPLTDTEKSALQKGMNFAIAPKKIPTAEFVAAVEDSITKLSAEENLTVRARVSLKSLAEPTLRHQTFHLRK
ncbi:uncharacterized protein [Montipora foliosa]|uniref:uncharacterized protein n=1 Tax=Montipora foliosa TaxID=591990 RepID=UPI0035F1D321